MPAHTKVKGLEQTSATIAIGFEASETAANTFAQAQIDLNLDPLNREVFVVIAIDLDAIAPDNVAGTSTQVHTSVTTTSQTTASNLNNSNCLATSVLDIRQDAGSLTGVPFARQARESPSSLLQYLGIIATNDFFVQIKGTGTANAKHVFGKMYGYRARASADIYAALVQSEVLSA